MLSLRTALLTIATTGAVLASTAAAQAAAIPFAVEQAPTRVAAWDGTVIWSHFDVATKTYSLVKSVDGGAPVAVGVPPRGGSPFDIDLGANAAGRTYGVYTRDGDIVRLNVSGGYEQAIASLSSPALDERDPTIQGGRIAFIRRDHGFDQLRIGDQANGSQSRSTLVVKQRSIVSAELGVHHIAYVVSTRGSGGFGELDVHVRNLSTHADRVVYRARSGGANFAGVTRPTYVAAPAGFLWARTNLGSGTGNRIVRYTLGGSRLSYSPGTPRYNSTAWAGPAFGVATSGSLDGGESQSACQDGGLNYCSVQLSGPLAFNLQP